MVTDALHEVIGHGGICLLLGHHIDMLTSVYFKSHPGSAIVDIGGPIINLLFAILIHVFLAHRKELSLLTRLLLLSIMAYNFLWFSGTILQSGFSKSGDWTQIIKESNIGAMGKALLITAGVIAYWISIKVIRGHVDRFRNTFTGFPLRQTFMYAWAAGAIVAILAGLFFKYDRLHAAMEGLLEMIGILPIVFIVKDKKNAISNYKAATSWFFTVTIAVLFVVFCLTLGRGIY
jgi:hypothetical protein